MAGTIIFLFGFLIFVIIAIIQVLLYEEKRKNNLME